MRKAIQSITNWYSIEVRVVNDETVEYKYSDENEWKQAEVELMLRGEDLEDVETVAGFKTEEGTEYFLDEFIVIEE